MRGTVLAVAVAVAMLSACGSDDCNQYTAACTVTCPDNSTHPYSKQLGCLEGAPSVPANLQGCEFEPGAIALCGSSAESIPCACQSYVSGEKCGCSPFR